MVIIEKDFDWRSILEVQQINAVASQHQVDQLCIPEISIRRIITHPDKGDSFLVGNIFFCWINAFVFGASKCSESDSISAV